MKSEEKDGIVSKCLAITYDVPGLRDANKTGFVVKGIRGINHMMRQLLLDEDLVRIRSKASYEDAKRRVGWEDNIGRLKRYLSL